LIIFDIHALQNRFYFEDNVIPVLVSGVHLFVQKLKTAHKDEEIAIVFPDEGACKRFGKMFAEWDNIICQKVRDGDKRIVTIKEGNVKGKHVFIVDDLAQTGGTLIQCQEVLLANGAACVSAYVTHAVFPKESWKKFTQPKGVPFKKFYVTNSCPDTADILKDKEPFEVLSLADTITDVLLKY